MTEHAYVSNLCFYYIFETPFRSLISLNAITLNGPLYMMGDRLKCLYNIVFLSLIIVFLLANSTDPLETLCYAAFNQCLHCMSIGIQRVKRLLNGIPCDNAMTDYC